MSRIMIPSKYNSSMRVLDAYKDVIDTLTKLSEILKSIAPEECIYASNLIYTNGGWYVYMQRTMVSNKPIVMTVSECEAIRGEFLQGLEKLIDECVVECSYCDTKIYKRYADEFCGGVTCSKCMDIAKRVVTTHKIETAYKKSIEINS